MLVDDCKDDDCNRGNHSPSKEANLPPFLWRRGGSGAVDALAGEKGILFFDVAFRGVVGRWARKKRFVACHGERLASKATKAIMIAEQRNVFGVKESAPDRARIFGGSAKAIRLKLISSRSNASRTSTSTSTQRPLTAQ